jgi:hypothetical protein
MQKGPRTDVLMKKSSVENLLTLLNLPDPDMALVRNLFKCLKKGL